MAPQALNQPFQVRSRIICGHACLADNDGNAALGDFGLAIAIDRSRMTMQGMMVGTVAYMAPEQALGRTPDAR